LGSTSKLGIYSINQSKNLAAPPDGQFSVGGNKLQAERARDLAKDPFFYLEPVTQIARKRLGPLVIAHFGIPCNAKPYRF
jgi:hypothetical protein